MAARLVALDAFCYQRPLSTKQAMPRNPSDLNTPERGSASAPDGHRIAKVMARAGLASRREAEAWIAARRVAVNGAVITSPAVKVNPGDVVTVDGKPLPQRERTRLFLFHKPRGLVTTTADPEGRPTIFDALPKTLPRLISVGRLDINTEGLLLLTNDGGLARVLEHPQTGWLRRYRVRAHGRIDQTQLDSLRQGIAIDGIHYGPIEATLDRVQGGNVWLTFAMREGKNREIRNVLGHLGLQVNRLIRLSFGPFQLGDLKEGAIEEVRTRVLRDQLGKKIAALADADFDAPIAPREEPDRARDPQSRGDRSNRERRAAREDEGGRRRPAFERRERRPATAEHEKPHKPRPWHGKDRNTARPASPGANEPQRPRKAGLVTDRRGRRVLVERIQAEAPPEPFRPGPSGKRRNPPPDRRRGPRPARPKPRGRKP
jgi:23S rRNA pseudouridine2605 synthase